MIWLESMVVKAMLGVDEVMTEVIVVIATELIAEVVAEMDTEVAIVEVAEAELLPHMVMIEVSGMARALLWDTAPSMARRTEKVFEAISTVDLWWVEWRSLM